MDYKKLAEKALLNAKASVKKNRLSESYLYPNNMPERMHPELEEDLRKGTHSLGKHPAFPEEDETSFELKIMGSRFDEVVKRYKRSHDVDVIDNLDVIKKLTPMVFETIALESEHKKALEQLAIKMIREEFDMSEDAVEINAELTPSISLKGTKMHEKPMPVEGMEFDSHDEIENMNAEVYKRRFLNAMTQGAAKKCNHMFRLVDDELTALDPRLPNKYSKIMSSADYAYFIVPKNPEKVGQVAGGVVDVEFPSKDNDKAVINAKAMIFPVLVHEIVKGVMELLSAHGLPKKKKMAEYVINKADYLSAEYWDLRLGPAIWGRFTDVIDVDDFHMKHHIYADLAALPAKEFHKVMREILAGTKLGKKLVKQIVDQVKAEIQQEEFNDPMGHDDDGEIEEYL